MFNRRIHRAALCGSAAAGALLALATPGVVVAQTATYAFDIPAQDVSAALIAYGRTSRQQLVFDGTTVRNKKSSTLVGEYPADEGLHRLLEGTGLRAEFAGEGAVRIVDAQAPQSGSAAGDGAEVEALIVTAQKREEDIQDVPIAISAFTQETLERSQVAGGPDLMTQVPNMTFTKTNFTSYSIQLRGIGTQAISATTDNAVAVAFNNTPFIRNRFFEQEFYDLQRVEVLRGPQGTLYGRNATAGVVNLISQKPKFSYEAKISGDVANYSSTRLEGMVNVPLVEDVVALRVAGAWTKREGFVTNELTGNPIDGRDLWSTRVSLRLSPSDRLDANLIWEHFEEDDDRLRSGKQLCHTDEVTEVAGFPTTHFQTLPETGQSLLFTGVQGTFSQGCAPASLYSPISFQVPNGLSLPYYGALSAQSLPTGLVDPYVSAFQSPDLRVIESTVDPLYKAKSDIVELQVDFDLTDELSLTSETAYGIDEIFSMQDFNRFNTAPGAWDADDNGGSWVEEGILSPEGVFCDPQIGCADRLVGIDVSTARSRTFSQEFRLASRYDGPLNFSLGANFLRYDTEDKYYVFFNSLTIYAARTGTRGAGGTGNGVIGHWQPGVTDNSHCLPNGYQPPNVDKIQDILGCVYIDPNPVTSLNDMGHNYFLSRNPYKLISYAAFGEVYYQITDALKLTGGLRWTVDKKQAPRIPSWILGADTVGYPVADVVEQEWTEPTGRVAIDWKPVLGFTDETLLYASYAHGYKAGGMNPPPAGIVLRATSAPALNDSGFLDSSATHPKTFEPEFVDAFELGAKNTLLDGRLTLNLATFYYDYKGYQISQIVNRSAVNLNFDTDVWGIELESDWRPVENLKLGLKLGYENTRVADGSRAIDLMDRTAGDPNWVLVRPFPTLPSNCVLPAWLLIGNSANIAGNPDLVNVGGRGGGNPGGCEETYILGRDPATGRIYFPFPYSNPDPNDPTGTLGEVPGGPFRTDVNYAAWSSDMADYPCWPEGVPLGAEYPGVDPACLAAISNGGAGFYKDLSGNELPNAPNFTATITADYTVPLPNAWLMTLHTDLYYQSEAWTRIFNTEGYDKLKAYTNVNLAAIFTNEDAGWKVMAYVKNVFDRDSITGAFLNSDDTGLTTNVFLTEPRLYGLRVTKDFRGGPWWTGAAAGSKGPYPLTVEISGGPQRQDAPYETLTPGWLTDPDTGEAIMPAGFDPMAAQNRDLDWGDARELKLTWRPGGSPWFASAALRYGRTNSDHTRIRQEEQLPRQCRFQYATPFGKAWCVPGYSLYGAEPGRYYSASGGWKSVSNWADGAARSRETHDIVDFQVGSDVGVGGGMDSSLALGLRYAAFESETLASMATTPDANLPDAWFKYEMTASRFIAEREAQREFEGLGPTLTWDGAVKLLGDDDRGRVDLDWSLTGGVLFGKQKATITGFDQSGEASAKYYNFPDAFPLDDRIPVAIAPRSKSTTTPVLDLAVGLSYDIQRIRIGAGYRWERYFDVLDVGYDEAKDGDRTLDGPYFKIAVGFGG